MRRKIQPITTTIAQQIRTTCKEYPKLGHEGIARVLEAAGVRLDDYELRTFMNKHHLNPGRGGTWKSKLLHDGPIGQD